MTNKGHNSNRTQTPPPKQLDGKRLACGPSTINRFSKLLIPKEVTEYSINAAGWLYNHFEISLINDTNEEFVFIFEHTDEKRDCFVRTAHLNIYFNGKNLPQPLYNILSKRIARYLQNVSLGDIGELVVRDPMLGAPHLSLPLAINDDDRPANLLDNWGEADLYSNFLAEGEMARGKLDSLDIFERASTIQHCDAECMNMKPNVHARIIKLVNYPWMKASNVMNNLKQQLEKNEKEIRDGKKAGGMMLTTNIQEIDLIQGNRNKLIQVLDRAVAQKNQEMIFFSNTCTPTVAGEDVHSLVKEYQKKSSVPLIYLTVTPQSMEEVFSDIFVNKRLDAQKTLAQNADPGAVNLIGFYKDKYLDELIHLLDSAGIRVNAIVLPEVDYDALRKIPLAAHNVFYPNSLWNHFYDQLKIQAPQKNHMLDAPYGMEGTRKWLLGIADAVGRGQEMQLVWNRCYGEYKNEWESLCKEASAYTLGVAFRNEESHHFTVPAQTWGIPLLKTVSQMGFGVDILFRTSNRKEAHDTARQFTSYLGETSNVNIKGFNNFKMMMDRLENSNASAFFSYHFFDWRLTSSGKSIFSTQDFNMGPRGAVASIKRLLALSRFPLYQKYAKYLKRTNEGLRID